MGGQPRTVVACSRRRPEARRGRCRATLLFMFKRIWWFAVGLTAGVGGSAWAMARVSRARKALTPANLRRSAVLSVADALEGAGSRLRSPNGQG